MMIQYLTDHGDSLYDLQDKVASGKKVRRPSDDPMAYSRIARFRQDGAEIDRFLRSTQRTYDESVRYDGILQQVSKNLQRVTEIVVDASDPSLAVYAPEVFAEEVDLIVEDLVSLANSTSNRSSLFGGLRTDTPAYTVTRDAEGRIALVEYQGNAGIRQVEIADGVMTPGSIVGTDLTSEAGLFQSASVDIFADLIQLRDRLLAGENPVELEQFTADAGADTLTVGNVYSTGCTVNLQSTDTLPGGLEGGRTYYAISVSPTEIRLANSLADARAGIGVDITDAGVGEHGITQQSLADADRNLHHVLSHLSSLGAREERLRLHESFLRDMDFSATEELDREESVDVAEAITEMSAKQVAYEAALRVTATMLDTSLVNLI